MARRGAAVRLAAVTIEPAPPVLLNTLQRQDSHFRWTVDPDRHVHRADTATDENRRLASPFESCHDRKFLGGDGTHDRKNDLTAVCVPRDDQWNLERLSLGKTPWVVREQHHGPARPPHDRRDV